VRWEGTVILSSPGASGEIVFSLGLRGWRDEGAAVRFYRHCRGREVCGPVSYGSYLAREWPYRTEYSSLLVA
jgi:hypothetical protein